MFHRVLEHERLPLVVEGLRELGRGRVEAVVGLRLQAYKQHKDSVSAQRLSPNIARR